MASIQFWYCFRYFPNLQTLTGCPTFLLPSAWNQAALHHVFAERRKQGDEENLCQQARSHGDKKPAAAQATEGWTMTELIEMYFKAIQTETLFPTMFKDDSDCNSSSNSHQQRWLTMGNNCMEVYKFFLMDWQLQWLHVLPRSDVWRHQVCFQIAPLISTFVWAVGTADGTHSTCKLCTTHSSESCWSYPELRYHQKHYYKSSTNFK